jgi:hypothetical protein
VNQALVYDLNSPWGRWELVLRVLRERDRKKEDARDYLEPFRRPFEDWLGNHCPTEKYRDRDGPEPRNTGPSLLKFGVTVKSSEKQISWQ